MPQSDPSQLVLIYEHWPSADRQAWDAMFAEGDVFGGRGVARHWANETRIANRKHYGRWLGWLAVYRGLESDVPPWSRVTPEHVKGYIEHLRATVVPRTVATRLIGLNVVIKAMLPSGEWRWLMDLTNRVKTWAEPSIDRSGSIRPIEEVHWRVIGELERLAPLVCGRHGCVAFRDAMIVLILSCAPIRRSNLASIQIGRHLTFAHGRAILRFSEAETKNHQRLVFDLPRHVTPWIRRYLSEVRPRFEPMSDCRHLWLGIKGRPLGAYAIWTSVVQVTRQLFGVPINPHSFRACAATSLAQRSPELALLAAPLLGHKYFGTTDRHYIKAKQLDASRRVIAMIEALRSAS